LRENSQHDSKFINRGAVSENMVLQSLPSELFWILFLFPAIGALLGVYWTYLDATARGSGSPSQWAIGCVVIPFLLIGYLLYRSKIGGRKEPASQRERLVGTLVVAHMVSVLGAVFLLPPDPFTQLLYYLPLVVIGLLPGYWLVWRRGYARLRHKVGLVHESERQRQDQLSSP
jgi:hypothetical protein